MIQDLINELKKSDIEYSEDEPLAQKSTFKIGGKARLFVAPKDTKSFITTLRKTVDSNTKFFILGGGSNVVFPDGTYGGAIISTQNLNKITTEIEPLDANTIYVTCQAGTPISSFINYCIKNSLIGAEQFAGLPGSVGGATFMNARCFEKSISDILHKTEHFTISKKYDDNEANPQIVETPFNAADWDYKKSPFQHEKDDRSTERKLILSSTFKLTKAPDKDKEKIESECKKYISARIDKGHFKFPSAGSVFKNNRDFGEPSGAIIDKAGLCGTKIGNAQIAPFHGNFIVNIGNATADDIKQLVKFTQNRVKKLYGFCLEPEIIFIEN